jgi:hypothetical protein
MILYVFADEFRSAECVEFHDIFHLLVEVLLY